MLAETGPSRLPIAIPSVCRYIVLLKLNLTPPVAVCISSISTAVGKSGGINLPK